jgi:hypothetical protein
MRRPASIESDVTVSSTLARMADVYRLSREGGPRSPRFQTYLRVIDEDRDAGYHAYNPMAGSSALETIELLLAADAETIAHNSARWMLAQCDLNESLKLSVIVATPGMWTHRLITEAEHRLRPERGRSHVQMWAGEPAGEQDVWRESAAETVRIIWTLLHGPAQTLDAALVREGLALALSGSRSESLSAQEHASLRDTIAAIGDSSARPDILGIAYGDPLAAEMGWPQRGFPDRVGVRYAAEVAKRWLSELGPSVAVRRRTVRARPPAPWAGPRG